MTASTLTDFVPQNTVSTDEYSICQYSSHDLDAVHALAKAVAGSDAYPKFLLAQLADILSSGFLIVRDTDARVAGFTVATQHAQVQGRGVILTLVVDPQHEGARQLLVDAATAHLRELACDEIVYATTTAPPAAPDAFADSGDTPAQPDDYRVRQFTPTDLDDVYRVEKSAFGDDPYPRLFFLQLADVLGRGFQVAERRTGDERRVVGYLLGVLDSGFGDRGWVMSLAVHTIHRGLHVGWQLMDEAESYFRAQSRQKVQLTVDPDNDAAVELYMHRKYEKLRRHDDLHGMKLSRLVMQLQLDVR